MKNGELESLVDSKLKKYEEQLDDIVNKVGISYVKDEVSIEALKLTYKQLTAMDQQECCIIAYKLSQYGLYIQSIHNRLSSIAGWADESLSRMVGKYAKNYGDSYTKYEEKRAAIINENSAAKALADLSIKANGKMQELYGVSQKIASISNILIELSKSKRYRNNG